MIISKARFNGLPVQYFSPWSVNSKSTLKRAENWSAERVPALKSAGLLTLRASRLKTTDRLGVYAAAVTRSD